jgi:enoyl-CoA hydratase
MAIQPDTLLSSGAFLQIRRREVSPMTGPKACEVAISDQVATVTIIPRSELGSTGKDADVHWVLGVVLDELRWNDDVRVIVLTGKNDGEFWAPSPTETYNTGGKRTGMVGKNEPWSTSQGIIRSMQALALIEKPVVGRINGDALGFGQSILLGCDIVIAREDALISDLHMSMGTVVRADGRTVGPTFALVPGDGALAWIPLSMTPQRAKEYLMLSRTYTGAEMADLGIVNYAVPLDQLDAKTDELVQELLSRPATALAMTKRLVNRHLVEQLHNSLDLSHAYEKINIYELDVQGWQDRFTLSGDE